MSDKPKPTPLPRRTAKYVTDPNKMSEAGIRGVICNPIYTGVPPYERMVTDEVWVRSATQLIEEEGPEQFLVNMLYMLRSSMVDAVPAEAIPSDYDGPWPDDEEDEEEEEDFPPAFDDSSQSPSPWHHPMEGLIYCSHDAAPMIILDAEFVCVYEYLYAHLAGACITDLIAEPVLTLVFQNGHTLPLLCPDCGRSLHVDDHNELLDGLNGLCITGLEWDDEIEALVVAFGRPEDTETEDEPLETLLVHLDSVRELTCPNQTKWHSEEED